MRLFRLLSVTCLLAAGLAAAEQEKQPVYIYLYSRYTDFNNLGLAKSRIVDSIPLVAKYGQKYQKFGISATVMVSGAFSRTVAEKDPELCEHLKLAFRRGLIQLGYDGTDEPTYMRRPRPDLANSKTPQARWLTRGDAAEKVLTQYIDPFSGRVVDNASGGLKAMQEIFDRAFCVDGLTLETGADTEAVHHLRRYNTKAIGLGIPPASPALQIHGFRGGVVTFGKTMAAGTDTSPDVFWMDNVLRTTRINEGSTQVVSAAAGPEALQKVLDALDRTHPRVVHVELADPRIYLSESGQSDLYFPATRWAYDYPTRPLLPTSAYADFRKQYAALDRQEKTLEWLQEKYMPANPGSRFVSSGELGLMSPPAVGQTVQVASFRQAVEAAVKAWTGTYPPSYLQAEHEYYSLADTFYLLANILAEKQRTGNVPEKVRLGWVYGPLEVMGESGTQGGSVTAGAVMKAAASLAGKLNQDEWKALPDNIIPTRVDVGGTQVNAAQFLRLMAEAFLADSPSQTLNVKMTTMYTLAGSAFPRNRLGEECGSMWTMKPAVLHPLQPQFETGAPQAAPAQAAAAAAK